MKKWETNIRNLFVVIICIVALIGCTPDNPPDPQENDFVNAVDISFLPLMRANGISFTNRSGIGKNVLEICKENGVNTIRLRLWHNPATVHSSLKEVEDFAAEIRALDLDLWLTVHYSDTWADPGSQQKPGSWIGLDNAELRDSVYLYSKLVCEKLKPEIIQIGNEINNGFLHPTGHRWNQEEEFKTLITQGIEGARAGHQDTKIMLHYAGINGAKSFFSLVSNLDFDLAGLSYYPKWHGKDLDAVDQLLEDLYTSFEKEIIIAETAYPFTLSWNDWTTNIAGSEDDLILPDFPASTDGQLAFISNLKQLIKDNGAIGLCYWGASYVAFDGPESTQGSPWENQALFGFNNQALKAIEVFQD